MLDLSPFTVCHEVMSRVPIKGLLAGDSRDFDYDEHEVELFVDELVLCMRELHAQIESKL